MCGIHSILLENIEKCIMNVLNNFIRLRWFGGQYGGERKGNLPYGQGIHWNLCIFQISSKEDQGHKIPHFQAAQD